MLVIVGYIVVCGSVFGGFVMSGGHLAVLFQPLELLMIGGAAVGASLVGNNAKTLKAALKAYQRFSKDRSITRLCSWS